MNTSRTQCGRTEDAGDGDLHDHAFGVHLGLSVPQPVSVLGVRDGFPVSEYSTGTLDGEPTRAFHLTDGAVATPIRIDRLLRSGVGDHPRQPVLLIPGEPDRDDVRGAVLP